VTRGWLSRAVGAVMAGTPEPAVALPTYANLALQREQPEGAQSNSHPHQPPLSPPTPDHLVTGIHRWNLSMDTAFSKQVQGGYYHHIGQSVVRDTADPRLGNELSWGGYLTLRPTSQLRFDGNFDKFTLHELNSGPVIFDTYVARGKLSFQFTKDLFLRVVGQYVDDAKDWQVDPLLSYKINPFTVFFVGSSHSFDEFKEDPDTPGVQISNEGYRQTQRLFFVKFQYLFRV